MPLRRATIVMVMVATLVMTPATASANFGSGACDYFVYNGYSTLNCTSLANNSYHSVKFNNLGNQIANLDDNMEWVINNVYDPTDLVAYRDESDLYPDVVVADADFDDMGFIAWVVCDSENTGTGGSRSGGTGWCRGQRLRYNSFYSGYYDTYQERRHVACHELGHTVGLTHPSGEHVSDNGTTCMGNNDQANYTHFLLNSHEESSHINSNY